MHRRYSRHNVPALTMTLKPDPDLIARDRVRARLKAELVVLTGARRRADLTMAVPLSASRLDRLDVLCRHWGGPVSAAVYVALAPVPGAAALLNAARRSLQALFDRCWLCTGGFATARTVVECCSGCRAAVSATATCSDAADNPARTSSGDALLCARRRCCRFTVLSVLCARQVVVL